MVFRVMLQAASDWNKNRKLSKPHQSLPTDPLGIIHLLKCNDNAEHGNIIIHHQIQQARQYHQIKRDISAAFSFLTLTHFFLLFEIICAYRDTKG